MIQTEYDNYWQCQNLSYDSSQSDDNNKVNALSSRSGYYSFQNTNQSILQGNQYLNHNNNNNVVLPQNNLNLQGKSNVISSQQAVPTSQQVWSTVQQNSHNYRSSFANNVNTETTRDPTRPMEYSFCNSQNYYNNYNVSNSQNSVIRNNNNCSGANNYVFPNYPMEFQNNGSTTIKPAKIRVKDVYSINSGVCNNNQGASRSLAITQETSAVNYPVDYISYLKKDCCSSQKQNQIDFSKNLSPTRLQQQQNSVSSVNETAITNTLPHSHTSNKTIEKHTEQRIVNNKRSQDAVETFTSISGSNNVMKADYSAVNESLGNSSLNSKRVKINPRRNICRPDSFSMNENILRDNVQLENTVDSNSNCPESSCMPSHINNKEMIIPPRAQTYNIQGNDTKEIHETNFYNKVNSKINNNHTNYQSNPDAVSMEKSSQYKSNNYRQNMHSSLGKAIENHTSTKIDQDNLHNSTKSSEKTKSLDNSEATDELHNTTCSVTSNLKFCKNNDIRENVDSSIKHINSDSVLSNKGVDKRSCNLNDQNSPQNSNVIGCINSLVSLNNISAESVCEKESGTVSTQKQNDNVLKSPSCQTLVNHGSVTSKANAKSNDSSHILAVETEKNKGNLLNNFDFEQSVFTSKKPEPKSKTVPEGLIGTKKHVREHEPCTNDRHSALVTNSSDEYEDEHLASLEEENMIIEERKKELYELEQLYKNKISRNKLSLLIKFLKSDVYPAEDSLTPDNLSSDSEKTNCNKRKLEDGSTNKNKRKLAKLCAKNRKNDEENISMNNLVEEKVRKAYGKSVNIENKCFGTGMSGENEKIKNSKAYESYNSTFDKIIPFDHVIMKDNEEETNENVFDSELQNKERKNISHLKVQNKGSQAIEIIEENKMSAEGSPYSDTIFQETEVVKIIKVIQKLPYHKCSKCGTFSPNNSFWINVVSKELKCLNCFNKMFNTSESKSEQEFVFEVNEVKKQKEEFEKKYVSKIDNLPTKSVKQIELKTKKFYDERRREDKQNFDDRKNEDNQNCDDRKRENKLNRDERKKEDKQNHDEKKIDTKQNFDERKRENKQSLDEDENENEDKQNLDERKKEPKRISRDHRGSFVKTIFEQKNQNNQNKEKKEKRKTHGKQKKHALKNDMETLVKKIENFTKTKDNEHSKDGKKSEKVSKSMYPQEKQPKSMTYETPSVKENAKKKDIEIYTEDTEERKKSRDCEIIAEIIQKKKDDKKNSENKEKNKEKIDSIRHSAKVKDSKKYLNESKNDCEKLEKRRVDNELLHSKEKKNENYFEGHVKNKAKESSNCKIPMGVLHSKESERKEDEVASSVTMKYKDDSGSRKIGTHSSVFAHMPKKTKEFSNSLMSES